MLKLVKRSSSFIIHFNNFDHKFFDWREGTHCLAWLIGVKVSVLYSLFSVIIVIGAILRIAPPPGWWLVAPITIITESHYEEIHLTSIRCYYSDALTVSRCYYNDAITVSRCYYNDAITVMLSQWFYEEIHYDFNSVLLQWCSHSFSVLL